MGTEQIAQRHYLQVTEDHWQAAAQAVHESGANQGESPAFRQPKAVHGAGLKKRENPEEATTCVTCSGSNGWAVGDSNKPGKRGGNGLRDAGDVTGDALQAVDADRSEALSAWLRAYPFRSEMTDDLAASIVELCGRAAAALPRPCSRDQGG